MTQEKEKVQRHFETMATGEWQSRYRDKPMWERYVYLTRRAAVTELLRDVVVQRVLDLGCGSGDYLDVLAGRPVAYSGIDFSANMIQSARERADALGIKADLRIGDVENLPYSDKTFDLVLAIGLIEYFDHPDALLREIRRVLTVGGLLVMQSYKKSFNAWTREIWQRVHGVRPGGVEHRQYGRRQLDALLAPYGFEKETWIYSHFRVFPYTFEYRFPAFYVGSSDWISRHCPRALGAFASIYLARYKLVS